jgi:hypothetical protein
VAHTIPSCLLRDDNALGGTMGSGSVVRLSALCKTATMADRFHVMGVKELQWTILQLPLSPYRLCALRLMGNRSIQRLSPPMELCTGPGGDHFEKEFAGRVLIPYTVAAGGLSVGWRSRHGV